MLQDGFITRKSSSEKGAQIDLIIDRADNCINLCEIKFTNNLFVINKAYEKEISERKAIFIEKTRTRKISFFNLSSLLMASTRNPVISEL